MEKIIFLDIDGILNHQKFYKKYDYKWRVEEEERLNDDWGDPFSPESVAQLNRITDSTGAVIVVSSTKRHIEGGLNDMNQMAVNRGITGEIIGITPKFYYKDHPKYSMESVQRGVEIKYWLEHRGFRHINWSKDEQQNYMDRSGISNYVILDDDSDMLYGQRHHFVHIPPPPRHYGGLDKKYADITIKKLNQNVVDLNY